MHSLLAGTPSTFSGVIAAVVMAGTMSSIANMPYDQISFSNDANPIHYGMDSNCTYSLVNVDIDNAISIEKALKSLVDKILASQVPLDIEFDTIIANNARKLYQHGFS